MGRASRRDWQFLQRRTINKFQRSAGVYYSGVYKTVNSNAAAFYSSYISYLRNVHSYNIPNFATLYILYSEIFFTGNVVAQYAGDICAHIIPLKYSPISRHFTYIPAFTDVQQSIVYRKMAKIEYLISRMYVKRNTTNF